MASLAETLKNVTVGQKRTTPLWKGPESDKPLGGITFSMLSRFLVCKERFRIHYMEGLRPIHRFNHRIEYGNMWHECEEAHAAGKPFMTALTLYCQGLVKKYTLDQEQIDHWYRVCRVQFPLYIKHWLKHKETATQKPIEQEHVFHTAYTLPSGRVVYLRGKRDSMHNIPSGIDAGNWLMENKSKGDIDIPQIQRQLTFDLQTMMYMTVVHVDRYGEHLNAVLPKGSTIAGVRYNVIRRPLSGGKGTIVRHKPSKSNPLGETKDAYYARLGQYIVEDPAHFFTRWNTRISDDDVKVFRDTCLDPILEHLCDWYDDRIGRGQWNIDGYKRVTHWRHPFGVYNVLDEGGSSDLDAYLVNGSEVGLERVESLFEELNV